MLKEEIKLSRLEQEIYDKLADGESPLNTKDLKTKYSDNLNLKLRELYDTMDYLTVAQAAIWLDRCTDSIYSYIRKGYLVASRALGPKSDYIIDVKKSKKLLAKLRKAGCRARAI